MLPPPGSTTLWRMQMAAVDEVARIERGQAVRLEAGDIKEPMPEQMAKRDDFAGIVRLFDKIMRDADLFERLMR